MAVSNYCRNGHRLEHAGRDVELCPRCGGEGLSGCPGCREPIPASPQGAPPPKYCASCGRPFPWTENALSGVRMAIRELAELQPYERFQLRRSIDHITRVTPETPQAITRINAALSRIGGDTAASLRELFLSIASEEVKPQIREAGSQANA